MTATDEQTEDNIPAIVHAHFPEVGKKPGEITSDPNPVEFTPSPSPVKPLSCTVQQDALKKALSPLKYTSTGNNPLPIQKCVLLVTEGDELILSGASYSTQLSVRIPAEVEKEGAATVPYALLSELVNGFPGSTLHLSGEEGNKVILTVGLSEYELLGLPAEEFPPLPETSTLLFTAPAGLLAEALERSSFAISDDPSRPQLTGARIFIPEKDISCLKIFGAEMARMVVWAGTLPSPASEACDFILSPEGVKLWESAFSSLKADTEVEILCQRFKGGVINQAGFRVPGMVNISRCVDGKYPNWEKVIPKDASKTFTTNRDEFITRIRRVLAASVGNKITLSAKGGKDITLSASSSGNGSGREPIEGLWDGDDLEMFVDGKLFMEDLQGHAGDTVTLEFKDCLSPIVIRDTEGQSDMWTCIQMPMHNM